jgi:hypothetical protein
MPTSPLPRALAVALVTFSAACAGKAPSPEPAGVLTIGVSTTGPSVAGLSFPIEVRNTRGDADPPRTDRVKADGGIATFRDLPDGTYGVRLTIPPECAAANGATRQVTIAPRRTAAIRFAITCR